MMNRKTIAATVVALAVACAVPLLYAGQHRRGAGQHGGGDFGFGPMARLAMLREKLNLTDAQVDQLRTIAQETRRANAESRKGIRRTMFAAGQLLLADPDNLSGAQTLLAQQQATEQQIRANILTSVSRGLKVLNAEQRSQLAELLAARAARFEQTH